MNITELMKNGIEAEKVQDMLDDFCELSGLAAVVTDTRGVGLTEVLNVCEYCSKMRTIGTACIESDEKGLKIAYQTGDTVIYTCHAGVIDLAVPILVNGVLEGSIMAGQVRLNQVPDVDFSSFSDMKDVYKKLYSKIPYITENQLSKYAKMLNILSQYIAERLKNLNRQREDDKKLLLSRFKEHVFEVFKSIRNLQYNEGMNCIKTIVDMYLSKLGSRDMSREFHRVIEEEIRELKIDLKANNRIESSIYLKDIIEEKYQSYLSFFDLYNNVFREVLYTKQFRVQNEFDYVIAYTECNFFRKLSVKEVADYMNISVDYFGKKFKRIFKKSYLDYLNELRIEKAKELLIRKRHSISAIALIVGYSDSAYFTTVFRKHTGLSPKEYQNNVTDF